MDICKMNFDMRLRDKEVENDRVVMKMIKVPSNRCLNGIDFGPIQVHLLLLLFINYQIKISNLNMSGT